MSAGVSCGSGNAQSALPKSGFTPTFGRSTIRNSFNIAVLVSTSVPWCSSSARLTPDSLARSASFRTSAAMTS
jgi:hypothetical protein